MMFYTYNKIQILHYRKDTASIESEQIDVFNEQVFGTEDGLKFAAALTSYNNFKEDEQDETIATLGVRHFSWGFEGSSYDGPITLDYCTQEELSLEEDDDGNIRQRLQDESEDAEVNQNFFPIQKHYLRDLAFNS